MRIHQLTVNNFGVFRGRHSFDLTPALAADGTRRHLVAISGQNGVGKSTLFQALGLALHGSLFVSDRLSRSEYQSYLQGRLHRANDLCEMAVIQISQHLRLIVNRLKRRALRL